MDQLFDEIFNLFNNLPYPDDDNISDKNSIEASYVSNYFRGKQWDKLGVKELQEDYPGDPSACLSFMTPSAFRYFFPGYMKMALIEYDIADAIFDVVINKLVTTATDPNYYYRSIFEAYDHIYLNAIAKYLVVMSDKYCKHYPVDEAALALKSYWSKYL